MAMIDRYKQSAQTVFYYVYELESSVAMKVASDTLDVGVDVIRVGSWYTPHNIQLKAYKF